MHLPERFSNVKPLLSSPRQPAFVHSSLRSALSFRALFCICLLVLCSFTIASARTYTISMLPRYSIEEINKRITALADYFSKTTKLDIVPILTTSFGNYQKQLAAGAIDIGFENPYTYVLASKVHEVIAMVEKGLDGDRFRGIVVTSADSEIKTLEDLKGKKISIVGYNSAGGYLSQRLSLLELGIDTEKDCMLSVAAENKQENVLFAVFFGDADAGFVRESALAQVKDMVPEDAVRVLRGTAWLPNWALSVNRNMPQQDKQKIIEAVQQLSSKDPLLKTLKITNLRLAEDSEYNPVRKVAGLELVKKKTKK